MRNCIEKLYFQMCYGCLFVFRYSWLSGTSISQTKRIFSYSELVSPSPINSTLQFKGDAPSNEIVGKELLYPLVYNLLCEDDDQRHQAYSLILNITTHILTHNWCLVGENRKYTTWGI